MDIRLNQKRAFVTGARVAVNHVTRPEAAQSLVHRIKDQRGEAIALQADVSDPTAIAQMFGRIDEVWGGIDILINNAGTDGVRAFGWEADIAEWRKVIEVNLFGAFYCAREALKRMVPQNSGVVLNITSVHEEIAWSGYSAYTASKAAVSMLTKTLAQEAAPHGVRVLAIGPGAIKTSINQSVWSDPKSLQDLLEKIPLKRIGEPEEIARMVVVLASEVASYVTGRTIFVDGGMTDYPDFAHGG
jgi:NAD(P)-dependent dehydrogenase (short-subunit alcohol dehydrogenase family)